MLDNTIHLTYTRFCRKLSSKGWNRYIQILPRVIQDEIPRYRRWQDRQARLFGKLLLIESLRTYGCSTDCLNNIVFDQFGRPFIDQYIDFNISHSEEYVVCAAAEVGRVGVDIERIKPVTLSEFDQCMSKEELAEINCHVNRYKKFFDYWTMKESAMKCDGKGLSTGMLDVAIDDYKAKLNGSTVFLSEIDINPDYSCHLATTTGHPAILLREIRFN